MRLCVFGAGYVGLVAAACFAEIGHQVDVVERDPRRLDVLRAGQIPFWEPGLLERVQRGVRAGQLRFVQESAAGLAGARVVFVAVGTPSNAAGVADLTAVDEVVGEIARGAGRGAVVVIKSTVPPGSGARLRAALRAGGRADLAVISNPEFLAEGEAVEGFLRPERVVLGGDDPRALETVWALYAPLTDAGRLVMVMDNTSAEMAKYASNAMLAARVSLINELSRLCEATGADIEQVRAVVGADPRIGSRYLLAGAGFGGSCFPKDLLALEELGRTTGIPTSMVTAARVVNEGQRHHTVRRLRELVGEDLSGLRVAVWGLAFKPETDDLRESPALVVVDDLIAAGAEVWAHDPAAMSGITRIDGLRLVDDPEEAVDGADALLVLTAWPVYRRPDLDRIGRRMRRRIVVDARNTLDGAALSAAGFVWLGMGRGPQPTPPMTTSDAQPNAAWKVYPPEEAN